MGEIKDWESKYWIAETFTSDKNSKKKLLMI